MKKSAVVGTIFPILLIFVGWGIFFLLKNFRGIYPAVFSTSPDAADLVKLDKSPLSHPEGFVLSIFASGLGGPRVIAFDPRGTMVVSITSAGKVMALPDTDNDGRADRIVELATNLNRPHGLAFSHGDVPRLYIAETNRVKAYPYDADKLQTGTPELIAELPDGGGHFTRTLLFMPPPDESKLLISVGSSCNVCEESDWRRAKILVIDTDGGRLEPFASGLRNSVFMTIRPGLQELWATEMGRDYLGDDLPPDEINIIRRNHDYGWPTCYGKNIPDTEYLGTEETAAVCSGKTPSYIDIQAHSAPLGLDFFPAEGWPEKYPGSLLVAYHGSWNRSIPTGYKVVLFRLDEQGNLLGREDFVSGWLRNGKVSVGRPVDVRIRENGVIYISDDRAGVIYRLVMKNRSGE